MKWLWNRIVSQSPPSAERHSYTSCNQPQEQNRGRDLAQQLQQWQRWRLWQAEDWPGFGYHLFVMSHTFLPENNSTAYNHFFTFSEKKWRMIYQAIAHRSKKSSSSQKGLKVQKFFLWALMGGISSTGVKEHSVMSNGNRPIYIARGFCSFISYISVPNIFQSPP